MRALRTSLVLAGLAGLVPAVASAQAPDLILDKFHPTLKGVDYDVPADKAAVAACKVDKVMDAAKAKAIGYELRDGQGQLLRRFVDSDAKPGIDQWSYFQNGFEVYRESDLNGDKSLDECRWLNSGGTRIAEVKGGKVVAWKRISAEEAGKVFVQALTSTPVDFALLETVMATPAELDALGLPKAASELVARDAGARQDQVAALRKDLVGWSKETIFTLFDGKLPHVIPADPALKLAADLTLYENPLILVGLPNGQAGGERMAYLQAPELVKVGEAWKFAGLPTALNPQKPAQVANRDTIRSILFADSGGPGAGPAPDPEVRALVDELAAMDKKGGPDANEDVKGFNQFHIDRIKLLRKLADHAKVPAAEKLAYNRQVVDGLIALHQTGKYPAAEKALDQLIDQGGKVASYVAIRKLTADYAIQLDDPNVNQAKVQAAYLASLEKFLKAYPKSDEEPDALFQLASNNEFNIEEKAAREYYARLVEQYPATDSGKKAAGALRRLDLVGKPIDLAGRGLDGQAIDIAKYRGKPLVVLFWTGAAEAGRRDLPDVKKVQEKAKGLEILGVCLDNDRDAVVKFLQANDLPWPQIYEPKGMDGDLANQFGIISLPTMFLVDASGKVVSRNVRSAADLDKQLNKDQNVRPAALRSVDK